MTDSRWRPGDPFDWRRPGELWTAGGLHAFVVESTGAQSGRTRRAILGYLDDGPDGWLGGGPRLGTECDRGTGVRRLPLEDRSADPRHPPGARRRVRQAWGWA